MKKIYLVRHTEYSNPNHVLAGRLPLDLSVEGKQHAQRLAEYFEDKDIVKIYSSAVKRCWQTSEILGQEKIRIESDQRLLETFSAYQGYSNAFDGQVLQWDDFYNHQPILGGETPQDIQQRMVSFFHEIVRKPEGNIIICSHGDPLYLLFSYLVELPTPDIKTIYEIPDEIYPPRGSVRCVTWQDNDNFEVGGILEV